MLVVFLFWGECLEGPRPIWSPSWIHVVPPESDFGSISTACWPHLGRFWVDFCHCADANEIVSNLSISPSVCILRRQFISRSETTDKARPQPTTLLTESKPVRRRIPKTAIRYFPCQSCTNNPEGDSVWIRSKQSIHDSNVIESCTNNLRGLIYILLFLDSSITHLLLTSYLLLL